MSALALGLAAGALTTGAWLPQLRRTWQAGGADTLSWTYLAVFGTGVAAWIVYGALEGDLAVVVTNAATLVLVVVLVTRKLLANGSSGGDAVP